MSYEQPHEVGNYFPANLGELLPPYDEIPKEFRIGQFQNPYVKFQNKWFFEGLNEIPAAKAGIDQQKAIRHLSAIQRSFDPKHEHKVAAVAWLASLWLKEPNLD